jgi:hypothetical protein
MKWTETIPHPGCFIIDFAANDTGPNTTFNPPQIEPHAPGLMSNAVYQAQVKMPNTPCTNCILRIRQYMSTPCPPKPLNDLDNLLYYSCANVILSASGSDGGATGGASGADAAADKAGDVSTSSGTGGEATGGTFGGSSGSGGSGSGSGGTVAAGGASGSGGASTSSGTGGASAGSSASESSSGCSIAASSKFELLPLGGIGILLFFRRRRARSLSRH